MIQITDNNNNNFSVHPS